MKIESHFYHVEKDSATALSEVAYLLGVTSYGKSSGHFEISGKKGRYVRG